PDACFTLAEVRIGIEFHWDHLETLSFRGVLELLPDGDTLTAVNELPIEEYLASLLGSEMREDWPLDALTAQAVAARSTVLATRGRHHYGEAFDLCHDDHCQCYRGVSRESDLARRALEASRGALLVHGGRVADARYAKSCGGVTEAYSSAWEGWNPPCLRPVVCGPLDGAPGASVEDLWVAGDETLRERLESPPLWAACNPKAVRYPASSGEMEALFRWRVSLSREELRGLINTRIGRDLGYITALQPLERGSSGRVIHLRIVGKKGSVTVGKELRIRRLLSPSHLPSSAFIVNDTGDEFHLEGIGWGHGVGLCQLGAAALAARGWSWERLLAHYYPGTRLVFGHMNE
ncbi:MAG TPA: SpoIID/LytB domain-containing protein, partial [Bacteroidetes bacterium]|nr:SpoIID/LytB domain-containing protein [Bacteroidota bacterium]